MTRAEIISGCAKIAAVVLSVALAVWAFKHHVEFSRSQALGLMVVVGVPMAFRGSWMVDTGWRYQSPSMAVFHKGWGFVSMLTGAGLALYGAYGLLAGIDFGQALSGVRGIWDSVDLDAPLKWLFVMLFSGILGFRNGSSAGALYFGFILLLVSTLGLAFSISPHVVHSPQPELVESDLGAATNDQILDEAERRMLDERQTQSQPTDGSHGSDE